MNKLLVTLLLALVAFSLSAQMGLFELSFGDSRADATANLLNDKGFKTEYSGEYSATFILEGADYIDSVELHFNTAGALDSWTVNYIPQDDEDIEEIALNAVISWHGENYYWDDYTWKYFWDFAEGTYVSAGFDADASYFVVEYFTPEED